MKVRGFKRIATGVAAASALALGIGVVAPGVAAADPPTIAIEQDGNDLTVSTTDANRGPSICMPILVNGATGLEVLVAYAQENYIEIADILIGGAADNVKFGKPASNDAINMVVPESSVTEWSDVSDGVYLLIGSCTVINSIGDLGAIVDPVKMLQKGISDMTIRPVIVPNGIGSVAPALDFGSTALQAGPALSSVLPGLMGGLG